MVFRILLMIATLHGGVLSTFAMDVTEVLQIIRCGTIENLQKAFDGTTEVNAKNEEGTTPLIYAAREGRGDMMLYLILSQKADLFAVDKEKNNLLHWAVIKDNFGIIQTLAGNLNGNKKTWKKLLMAKNDLGLMPIHYAAQKGNEKIVELLLQSGANANVEDANGKTPLYWAAKKGHQKVVNILLSSKSVDVNYKTVWGMTALHEAARGGNTDALETLLGRGAEVDCRDIDGRTPLYWASERGHPKAVEFLLEKKADPMLLDLDKRNPLHRAARYGHTDVVRILIEKGKVDVDSQDPLQETALCWAARNGHIDTADLLLSSGASLQHLLAGNPSVFHEVIQGGNDEMIKFLVKKGLDVNTEDTEGKTALHYAAAAGKGKTVALLVAQGADANKRDQEGKAPLDEAAGEGTGEAVEALLQSKTEDGSTEKALQHAIKSQNIETVETLLNNKRDNKEDLKKLLSVEGLNLLQKDVKGQTVFDFALRKKHIKLLTNLVLQQENLEKVLQSLPSEKKANLNTKDEKDGLSMLHYAALMHEAHLAEVLIKLKVHVDVKEKKSPQSTPLHYAVSEKATAVLEVLLNGNTRAAGQANTDRDIPFIMALDSGFGEGVQLFLKNGVDPTMPVGGKKPIDKIIEDKNTQMIALFMDYFKGDIKAATFDENGKPVQPEPGVMDSFDTDKCLVKMKNENGMTVAHWVAKEGHAGLLDVLFDKSKMATRIFIAGIDKSGRTPLHYAAAGGYADIIEKLLTRDGGGLDINTLSNADSSAGSKGRTSPLHEAAIHHQIPAVKKLLDLRADKTLLDQNKKTAFDYLQDLDDKTKIDLGMMPPPPPPAKAMPAKGSPAKGSPVKAAVSAKSSPSKKALPPAAATAAAAA